MYRQIHRRFKLGRFVGEAFRSTNGILQGCPISVVLLNALMMMHIALGHNVSAESYVDDVTLLSLNSTSLQRAMDVVSDFMGLSDKKVNEKKTKCFAKKDPPAILYEGKALGTTDEVKILGVAWVFKDGYFELNVQDRKVEEMCAFAHMYATLLFPFSTGSCYAGL